MLTILWILAAAIIAVAVYFNARCSGDTDSIIEWFGKLYGREGNGIENE